MKIDVIIDRFLNAIIKNRSFDLFESVLGLMQSKSLHLNLKKTNK